MANGLSRAPLDLRLDVRTVRSLVHENAELFVVDEKTACDSVAILLEGNGLDRQIENLTADKHTNEAEQAARNLGDVLGSVLHNYQAKHSSLPCKVSKSPFFRGINERGPYLDGKARTI